MQYELKTQVIEPQRIQFDEVVGLTAQVVGKPPAAVQKLASTRPARR